MALRIRLETRSGTPSRTITSSVAAAIVARLTAGGIPRSEDRHRCHKQDLTDQIDLI